MKQLKYQKEIDELNSDFSDYKEQNVVCYRWTFDDINDPRNFLPRGILKPDHPSNSFLKWGLSLFATSEQAKNKLNEMLRSRKNLYKVLGTHIAEGGLTTECGVSNQPENNGHFTLFEYIDVNLHNSFNIILKCYE